MSSPTRPVWSRNLLSVQAPRILKACICSIILIVLTIFALNYPAHLPGWRFTGTEAALACLLALNVFWPARGLAQSRAARPTTDLSFLVSSVLLLLLAVWMSRQFDVANLLTIVCIQAYFRLGVKPGGLVFGAGCLAVYLAFQISLREPPWAVVGRELALLIGVVFSALVAALLRRSTTETERAEALLKDLQAANRRLEEARQAEMDVAVAQERLRLARELHDSVTQSLYSVSLYAEAAADLLSGGDTATAGQHVRQIAGTAREALREMRLLVFELHTPALERDGLAGALQARLDAVESRGGIHAELETEGAERLGRLAQEELYGVAREALNNVLKHAQAHTVCIHLRFADAETELSITDDGVGFDVERGRMRSGLGMTGMEERALKIGGSLRIDSKEGAGTTVTVRVPSMSPGVDPHA